MTLPVEYQNLIKSRALELVQATPGAVAAFLQQAENYLKSAKQIDPKLALQVFTNAYEGYFQLVDAFLEHNQVRTKEAGRNLVLQRVSADMKLGPDEMRVIIPAQSPWGCSPFWKSSSLLPTRSSTWKERLTCSVRRTG